MTIAPNSTLSILATLTRIIHAEGTNLAPRRLSTLQIRNILANFTYGRNRPHINLDLDVVLSNAQVLKFRLGGIPIEVRPTFEGDITVELIDAAYDDSAEAFPSVRPFLLRSCNPRWLLVA